MKRRLIALTAWSLTATPLMAADNMHYFPLAAVIEMGVAQGKLDGSVAFYLEGQDTPSVASRMGEAASNKKTNSFNKDAVTACNWAALSALMVFENSAKRMGANAVIGMHSWYKKKEFKHPENFECAEGAIMAGVTLKGTYARVAR